MDKGLGVNAKWRIAQNAIYNIFRGSVTAVVALALPHFLTRELDLNRFAAWVLMLQISAYASYLDFGLQTAVARYVAQAMERGDKDGINGVASTSILLLLVASFIALGVIACILVFLPELFRKSPLFLLGEIRLGVIVLALSIAANLPLSTFSGIFVGIQLNRVTALAIGGSRLLGALSVLIVVRFTHSLVLLALCIAVWNLLGGLVQVFWAHRTLPFLRVSYVLRSYDKAKALVAYCSSITLVSFCMIIISGMDLTVVGHYDFVAAGSYSVATTLTTFLYGLNAMVCAAFYAPLAIMDQRQEYSSMRNMLVKLTRISSLTNVLAIIVLYICGAQVLTFWVGADYARKSLPILKILMIANSIRMIAGPFASGMFAMGEQSKALTNVIAEALVNLACSIIGAKLLGAIGVAYGTLAGAVVGMVCITGYTSRKMKHTILSPTDLIYDGAVLPALCLSPLALCCVLTHFSPSVSDFCYLPATLFSIVLVLSKGGVWKMFSSHLSNYFSTLARS